MTRLWSRYVYLKNTHVYKRRVCFEYFLNCYRLKTNESNMTKDERAEAKPTCRNVTATGSKVYFNYASTFWHYMSQTFLTLECFAGRYLQTLVLYCRLPVHSLHSKRYQSDGGEMTWTRAIIGDGCGMWWSCLQIDTIVAVFLYRLRTSKISAHTNADRKSAWKLPSISQLQHSIR